MALTLGFSDWLRAIHAEALSNARPFKGPMLFLEGADHVIRFERLQEGFNEALRQLGIEGHYPVGEFNVTTERVDSGQKRDYRELYDAGSIAIVQKLYAPVLDRFGYEFGDIGGRQAQGSDQPPPQHPVVTTVTEGSPPSVCGS